MIMNCEICKVSIKIIHAVLSNWYKLSTCKFFDFIFIESTCGLYQFESRAKEKKQERRLQAYYFRIDFLRMNENFSCKQFFLHFFINNYNFFSKILFKIMPHTLSKISKLVLKYLL